VGGPENARRNAEELSQGLRVLGHERGRTFTIDERSWSGDPKTVAPLIGDVLAQKPDVLVTGGTNLVVAAKAATQSTPIVVAFSSDLASLGAIASYARPGGNLTGFTTLTDVMAGKRLELLAEALPGVRKVVLLQNPTHKLSGRIEAQTKKVAAALGIQIDVLHATNLQELEAATDRLGGMDAQAVLVSSHALFVRHAATLIQRAMKQKVPVAHWQPSTAQQGALLVQGIDMAQQHHRVASYVDRILRGARPGDLPIEQVTTYDVIFNLKTAKALGLKVPEAALLRAARVID